jgi:hypothetical protein
MVDASSPSWWQTERTRNSPTTLRHVNAHLDDYYREYKKGSWHPSETTPYDGPPLELEHYEAGYAAVTQASTQPTPPAEVVPEPPIIIEEPEVLPARPAWMTEAQATDLFNEIWDQYTSEIHAELTHLDGDRYYTSIHYGPGDEDWYHFEAPDAWRLPSPEAVDAIEAARRYNTEQSVIPTEVGASEEALISMEPPDVPISMDEEDLTVEELTNELQRGLHPHRAPDTEELTPLSGMRLFIANALLKSILAAGYRAESVPITADQAYLRVEVAPGTWQNFESAVAWHQWRASSRASPGSIGAVLSAAGQRSNGQAMEARQ